MRIGIIGGGIAGLSCAHYLVRQGVRPVVFESSQKPRASRARDDGANELDPFPMALQRSDTAICGLITDLGLNGLMQWQRTPSAVHVGGTLHRLGGWRDLLRFQALPPAQRLRTAAATYASMFLRTYAKPLDSVSARDWFTRTTGERTYETLWRGMLAARFGSTHVDDMPAYLAWQSLREELLGATQVTGILRGGFAVLCETLAASVQKGGGEIWSDTPVRAVSADERHVEVDVGHGRIQLDAVIAAIPVAQLAAIVSGELAPLLEDPVRATRTQEITSLRVWLRGPSPLTGYYRVLMLDRDAPFPVLLDASTLLPDAQRHGRSLLYLVRLGPAVPRGPGCVESDALETLRRLDPGLCASQLEESRAFRWESPEPVWNVDALRRPIPRRLGKTPLHVCTAGQAYPRGATPEVAVMMARDAVARVLRETP